MLERSTDGWGKLYEYFRGAIAVWDISIINIDYLERAHGIKAIHVPLGWAKEIEYNLEEQEKSIDVLFSGKLSERRDEYLKPIIDNFNNILISDDNLWGQERREAYSKSRVSVNVHSKDGFNILEIHRIMPLVLNGVYVVSERSEDKWYDKKFENIVTFVNDKDEMLKAVQEAVSLAKEDPIAFNEVVDERKYKLKRALDFTQVIRKVISERPNAAMEGGGDTPFFLQSCLAGASLVCVFACTFL
jgi:hypothetical protein